MPSGPLDELYDIKGPRTWDELTSLEQASIVAFRGIQLGLKWTLWIAAIMLLGLLLLWMTMCAAEAQTRTVSSPAIVARDSRVICPMIVSYARRGDYSGRNRRNPEADLRQFARARGYTPAALDRLFGLCADYTAAINRRQGLRP